MKKISTNPFFYKRIFPFIFTLPFLVFAFLPFAAIKHPPPPFIVLFPCLPWLVILVLWWNLYYPLADEVLDCGDALLIKMKGQEFSVPLANIINVNTTLMMSPPIVLLRLRTEGRFGRDITFLPIRRRQFRLWQVWTRNELLDELIDRIDAQRLRLPRA
jgi:hypothetical protein